MEPYNKHEYKSDIPNSSKTGNFRSSLNSNDFFLSVLDDTVINLVLKIKDSPYFASILH